MSSIQERLQLKRVPLDTWNIREQLCLASAVVRSGDQNWMSVSRALKTVSEPNRPNDWYSQKSCAAQYGALLEHVETPKRKKRSSEGAAETPQESILKRLTQERIVEIQKNVAEMTQQYEQIQNEIIEVRNQSTSEERLREIWTSIEAAKRVRERENARRAAWLKEREEKRARAERTWRPPAQAQPGAPAPSPPVAPSSPLLTSLLKSSPVVTTPQHISHPANVVETVSPSAGAPTLSMLLEKSGASPHETKHAAIEHIKSQLVQIEHQLKASGSTPPPALAGPLDLDDIDIKPEDVYAFRDVDLPIPPLSVHKPARPTEKQFKKEDGDGVPETSAKEDTVQVDTVQVIAGQVAPGQVDEVKIAFPEVKFPTPEIKVIQDESKIKEEVKEPEVPVPEPEVEPEVMVDVENESEIVVEDTSVQPEQQPAVEPEVAEEQPGTAPATFDIPLPPEAEETTVVDVSEPPLAEEEQLQVTTVEIEPEVTEAAPEVAPEAEVTTVDVKTEEEEEVPLNTLVQEEVPTVPEVEVKEEQPEPEETHTETDDDTPMELSREEEKDGKKKRDYSRKKKPDSRACSGSESAAEASAPESPSASDAERQHKLWKKSVMLVYSRLCAHKYASLFLRPISDEEAPGYSMVVRRPMDLTTIRRNIEAGHIRTTAEFQRDVLLMLSNALMYNSSEHSVYMMARDMHDEAHSQLSILVAAQAHAGLVAAPARRKRRRPDSPPPAPAPAAPKRHH